MVHLQIVKGFLTGRVITEPEETRACVRFEARFEPHTNTEVTVTGSAREEARKVKVGDRITIEKLANLGYCKVAARSLARLVSIPV